MKKLISLLALTTIVIASPTVSLNIKNNSDVTQTSLNNNKKSKSFAQNNIFNSLKTISYQFKNIKGKVNQIENDGYGDCLVGTSEGLYHISPGSKNATFISGAGVNNIDGIVSGYLGNSFVWTKYGFFEYLSDYGELAPLHGQSGTIQSIKVDGKGNFWVWTSQGLYYFNSSSLNGTKVQGIFGVNNIQLDSQGNCWAGMYYAGLSDLYYIPAGSTTAIKIQGINDNVMANDVETIKLDSQGNCWAGTTNGLYYIPAGSTTAIKIQGINDNVPTIKLDSQGNCWVVTDNSLYCVLDGSSTAKQTQGISGGVNQIKFDSQGNCWAADDDVLYYVPAGSLTGTQVQGISGNIDNIQFDIQGNCWVVTDNSLYCVLDGSSTAIKIQGINDNVPTIKLDSQGNCWAGTTNGLYYIPAGSSTAIKIQGINDNVPTIKLDSQGNCWAGTSQGLYFIELYNYWIHQNISLTTTDNRNLVWLKPDQLSSNGIVTLKTTDQQINTITVNGKTISETGKQWDFAINDIKDKNQDYSIDINATIYGTTYDIDFTLSSLLAKPTLQVTQLASNGTNLNPIWFQQKPNTDFKKPTAISEAYVATSAVNLTLPNPTSDTTETATIYGLNSDFTKTGKSEAVTNNLEISGNELGAVNGLFEVDVTDSASNEFTYYLQIEKNPTITNFFNTKQGKYFVQWANDNNINQDYINGLLKVDDSASFNKIITTSQKWTALATYQDYANNLETSYNNLKIENSKSGLTQQELEASVLSQINSKFNIDNMDTKTFDKTKVSVVATPPKNGKTYQVNEKVSFTISYNGKAATAQQDSLVITPYVAPPSAVSHYMWLIILVCCLAGIGLIYILAYKLWIKKALEKRKTIAFKKHIEQVRQELKEQREQEAKENE